MGRAVAPRELAPLSGVILCGGQSRRMGRDKAELELGGERMLDRVLSEVASVCSEVLLACGPHERYKNRGLRLVLDGCADGGPLAGIVAALETAREERALVVACDMPRVCRDLFLALAHRAAREELDVCWFESERGVEPLCAVYSRRCVPVMRAAFASGKRRVTSFVDDSLQVGTLNEGELGRELRGADCALNLNTRLEFDVERQGWGQVDNQ